MNASYHLAIPFRYKNDLYNDIASEFNILFFQSKNKIEKLIEFVQEYPEKKINISFPEGVNISIVDSINAVSNNIYIRLKASDLMAVKDLKNKNIKFFFDYDVPVTNYTNLDAFIRLGVSDIYIADDLCYNMKELSHYCQEKNVKIRFCLNHIPSTSFDKDINPRSPIFRPEDIKELNKYIDVFEFDCGKPYDWTKFDVLYRTWFVNKHWHGALFEINEDIGINFHNDAVYPSLNKVKMNCGRRCNQRISNHCKKCDQWISIAESLTTKKMRFFE